MERKYLIVAFAAAYAIGALVGLELFGLNDLELAGYVLSETATTISGYDVAYHHVLSIGGLAGAYALNQPTWSRLDSVKQGLIGLSVVILLVSIVSPETIESTINDQTLGIVVFGLQSGGYWGIAHS